MKRAAWLFAGLMVMAAALASAPVAAQNGPQGGAPPVVPTPPAAGAELPNVEQLKSRITELEAIAEPTAPQTQELEALRKAVTFLDQRATVLNETEQLDESASSAPARLVQFNEQLAKPIEESMPALPDPSTATIEQLQTELASARTRLEAARKERGDLETEFARRNDRREGIPEEINQTRQRLEAVRTSLNAPPPAEQPVEVTAARRASLVAERAYLEALQTKLDSEVKSYDARRDLIRVRRQIAERGVLATERFVEQLDALLTTKRQAQAEEQRRQAEQARRAAANAHPVVREIAEENADYATLYESLAGRGGRTEKLSSELQKVRDLESNLANTFESIEQQIANFGLTDAVGLRLRKQRVEMPNIRDAQRRLREIRDEINRVYFERSELDRRQLELVDLNAEAQQLLEQAEIQPPPEDRETVLAAIREGLTQQKDKYLADLINAYDIYLDQTLSDLEAAQRELVATVDGFSSFIDANVLWIQSSAPLSTNTLRDAVNASIWLTDPASWYDAARAFWSRMRASPLIVGFGLLMVLVLYALRLKFARTLENIGRRVERPTTDRFSLTSWAILLTIAIATPWPLLCWVLGAQLEQGAGTNEFIAAVGAGFTRLATFLLATQLLRHTMRPDGLGESHFNWKPATRKLVRRQLLWFVPAVIPAAFIVAALDRQSSDVYQDSLGRLAFIYGMALCAVFIWRLFLPHKGMLQETLRRNAGGWLNRLRFVWFGSMLAVPIALAVASAFGYFYTALQLERRVIATVLMLLGFLVVHELVMRWLYVLQRRLAIEQARKRLASLREQQAAERAREAEGETVENPVSVPEESQIDVAAISQQTQKLVHSLIYFAAIAGVYFVWVPALPAFGILETITVWTPENESPITAASVLFAAIALLLTFIVARNIPGLLEITVLQRLPITPGGRYAISTIVSYILVIVGIIIAFNGIGISWSKLQWLVAALSVGLGFGLQEIFANFVSGLILLFERPVRVGDTVTVSNVSGTVMRIRMRATTILDWDRKELIIPNKELVTGQVINWTLSDTTMRLILPVGLAYGSDTTLAKRLLLKVAEDHPNVLREPPPQALFIGFGDSTLNFELRVFLPSLEFMVRTRDELLMGIDQTFRRNKIEIAFPQRDVHVRSIKDVLKMQQELTEQSDPQTQQGEAFTR